MTEKLKELVEIAKGTNIKVVVAEIFPEAVKPWSHLTVMNVVDRSGG